MEIGWLDKAGVLALRGQLGLWKCEETMGGLLVFRYRERELEGGEWERRRRKGALFGRCGARF